MGPAELGGGGEIDKIGNTFRNDLDIGQGLVFPQITRCQIVRIIVGQCSVSTAFRHQMALVVHACEKLLRYYQV